uniref:Protein kinase domain-containing protein n=1 Tax=Labrus bergylta TaxID=56723 RepID=A0A3Q3GJQ3_9LABR
MFLVFRAATEQGPAAEGWIPGFVLGHTSAIIPDCPEGTIKGRFSVVKRCDQRGTKRTVAVKHVNKKLMRRDRVTQELNLLQRLQHPHIVSLIDTYETPASYALVMEMADQGRLLDYIVSWGNLTEEKVACYLRDILEALHYLHNSRIVHLDVKPENMLVTGTSGQPTVKLTDFGDAVQLNSAHYVHPLLGSPEFASPELVLGEPVSLNSDMWSLGVVTYVLLSGASPFLDESAEETCLNICQLDFSFPRDYFQGVSQAARDFICLLLRTDPGRRPPAGLCLQEPWLQVGTAEGRARAEGCLDTSRLISFIDRRKHQTDARAMGGVRSFIQSRLQPQSGSPFPILNLDLSSSLQSRKLLDALCLLLLAGFNSFKIL